jgi:hypothetical protein
VRKQAINSTCRASSSKEIVARRGRGPGCAGTLEQLWGEDAVKCLPLADEAGLAVVDQYLGGVDAGVVVGGEGHAVGAGVEEDGEVSGAELGEGSVTGEEVAGLADGAYDVGGLRRPVVCDHRKDLVVSLVEGWADEVVHGGVGDDEVLGAVLLGVEDAGEQCSSLADEEASGLEEQVGVEAVEGRADGFGVGCDAGCGVEGFVAVLDAEASSSVDVADVEAVGTEFLY